MIDRVIGITQLIALAFLVAGGFVLLGLLSTWLQSSR